METILAVILAPFICWFVTEVVATAIAYGSFILVRLTADSLTNTESKIQPHINGLVFGLFLIYPLSHFDVFSSSIDAWLFVLCGYIFWTRTGPRIYSLIVGNISNEEDAALIQAAKKRYAFEKLKQIIAKK